MKKITFIFSVTLLTGLMAVSALSNSLVWPSPPDRARLEFVGEIRCSDLHSGGGFFGKLKRFIGGASDEDQLSLPFDLLVKGDKIYMTCQNIPALIEIDRNDNSFKLHRDKEKRITYPISVCDGGEDIVYLTDSEAGIVFSLKDGKLKPFITKGLQRPTGIAAAPEQGLIFVVDTKDHSVKVFDEQGTLKQTISEQSDSSGFHFPTFAASASGNQILITDALNYRIKRFNAETGEFLSEFGFEGDGPGAFSRPKGLAVDSENHIYVVDNMFDNIQIFDESGRLLLVLGSRGQSDGQFWSPSGIDISDDTLFVADTFNDRIQVIHYLGEDGE